MNECAKDECAKDEGILYIIHILYCVVWYMWCRPDGQKQQDVDLRWWMSMKDVEM